MKYEIDAGEAILLSGYLSYEESQAVWAMDFAYADTTNDCGDDQWAQIDICDDEPTAELLAYLDGLPERGFDD